MFYAERHPPFNELLEFLVITYLLTYLLGEGGSNVRRPALHTVRIADLVVPAGLVLGVLVLPSERPWANDANCAELSLNPLNRLVDLLQSPGVRRESSIYMLNSFAKRQG